MFKRTVGVSCSLKESIDGLEQIDVNPYLGLQIYEDSKFCTHKGDRIDLWIPQAQTHALEKAQISHT